MRKLEQYLFINMLTTVNSLQILSNQFLVVRYFDGIKVGNLP